MSKLHWRKPSHLIAGFFGVGTVEQAPGTAASFLTQPLILLLKPLGWQVYLLTTLSVCVLGVWVSGRVSQELNSQDPSCIVIDEVAGMMITYLLVPFTAGTALLGFVLFRILDIKKPGPIGWADQHVHGGFGIMLDDIIAGGLTTCILGLAQCLLPASVIA